MGVGLSDSESLLKKATKDLQAQWARAGTAWNDKAREEFDKDHLEELRVAVANAGRGMTTIDQVLRRVINDCR